MVKLYRTKWHRNPYIALICYLRDVFIYFLPFKLPFFLIRVLYGVRPKFIFLVHPRRSEDIFRALPFLSIVRKIFSKKKSLEMIKKIPPFVITEIKTSGGIEGVVASSLYLPEALINKRRATLKEAYRAVNLSKKIAMKDSVMGLGAWWPAVTRRGLAVRDLSAKSGIKITNGHTGTLISLYLTIKKILKLGDIGVEKSKIVIIGAGKMGTNLGRVLVKEIDSIGIIDINDMRLKKLANELRRMNGSLKMETVLKDDAVSLSEVLNKYHLGVCVTSNARRIIKAENIPSNFIIIDDSRPEAISREDLGSNKIVLEGGLMKVNGLSMFYDYGFGIDENVFGCLAETYILAKDEAENINPTLGDVNIKNFYRMLAACQEYNIEVGDLKSQDVKISEDEITKIIRTRERNIQSLTRK